MKQKAKSPRAPQPGADTNVPDLAQMTPAEIADRIEFPLREWPGNCFGVATAIVEAELVPSGSRPVYGHWTGNIAATSMFASRIPLGFTGHGWVLTPEGQIIDPTRYVFEDVEPYIYVGADPTETMWEVCRNCEHLEEEHEDAFGGRCEGGDNAGYDCGPCLFEMTEPDQARTERREYDEGGNRHRERTMRPYPAAGTDPVITADLPLDVQMLAMRHGHLSGGLTLAQVFWLANLPLQVLGGAADAAYQWLIDNGHDGLIPIDNRLKVLRDPARAA